MEPLQLNIKCNNEYLRSLYENSLKNHTVDSGIDLFFPSDVIVKAKETVLIDLDIICECKMGDVYSGYFLVPRSSIVKTPLRMSNSIGIIDCEYRHTLKVCVDNISDVDYKIKSGIRLFQIITHNLIRPAVHIVSYLQQTNRGEGFGSTGI